MAIPTDPAIVTVERSFETPADVVWASLTRPEILAAWFRDGAEAEARPGGVLRDSAGDAGEFLEVEEPRRLVLSWKRVEGDPARLVIEISEQGERTALKVQLSALPTEKERVRQAEFWHWAVDSLEAFLKGGFGLPYEPWREMQVELHRRAAVKSAEEAEEERREAGVVMSPLADAPVMPVAARKAETARVTKQTPAPEAPKAAETSRVTKRTPAPEKPKTGETARKAKPAAKKTPAKKADGKKPKSRDTKTSRRRR